MTSPRWRDPLLVFTTLRPFTSSGFCALNRTTPEGPVAVQPNGTGIDFCDIQASYLVNWWCEACDDLPDDQDKECWLASLYMVWYISKALGHCKLSITSVPKLFTTSCTVKCVYVCLPLTIESTSRIRVDTTPFAERGRVQSCCNHRVVAEEHNYQTQQLGNKMLTSTKHTTELLLHDNGCNVRRAWIWLVKASFCHGNNSMVAAWPDLSLRSVWFARLYHT